MRLKADKTAAAGQFMGECGMVLNDAKKALRDLDSPELLEGAKTIIDEIISLEGHQLVKAQEEEQRENQLYEYWFTEIRTPYLYHGSTMAAVEKIKRYGLMPSMRPWDRHDWDRFLVLYQKGYGFPFHFDSRPEYKESPVSTIEKIHITSSKELAIGYALQKAPAVWAESAPGWREVEVKYGGKSYTHRNFSEGKRKFLRDISTTGRLTPSEVNECIKIFFKLWKFFDENDQPVLIYISVDAPAVVERYGKIFTEFRSFLSYLDYAKKFPEKVCFPGEYCRDIVKSKDFPITLSKIKFFCDDIGISSNIHGIGASHANLIVEKRIPSKYILKIEPV